MNGLAETPAFPRTDSKASGEVVEGNGGMTLREYYAGQALGVCTRMAMDREMGSDRAEVMETAAVWAVMAADALLEVLEK